MTYLCEHKAHLLKPVTGFFAVAVIQQACSMLYKVVVRAEAASNAVSSSATTYGVVVSHTPYWYGK